MPLANFGPFFSGEKPTYVFTVKDRDTKAVVDLSGYTAKVMLRKDGATANKFTTPSQEDATIPTGTDGVVNYTMPTAWDDADSGAWTLQLELTPTGGGVRKTASIKFQVEKGLSPSA